ncbi:MurR/RpiR family transcriptional regulator [Lysinibacter cavernae]|uniref:DNA-binding MurR/RpiR family transcriptional regulator n=1 Tax=Lysinibacter cavernae TaxID=1640652 RepID=A0A7X5R1L5_9MICO|nr:DNA-binding MurR/RpiR family transcriptional regulator [Lysinibacter cavernae]
MWSNATQEGTAVVEDVLGTIKRSLATLSATERKVAESVLAEPGVVVENTVTELAERCGVSSATVARFCQTLGFSGYRQFRLEVATTLSREQAERNRFEIVDDEIDPSDGIEDVISKVLYHEVLAIEQTMRGLDRPSVEQASKALVHANRIEVCGFGASGITAHDLHQKLSRIGRPSSYSPDVHFVLPSASLLGKGDVLVAFSHSGATAETLSVAEVAASAGATVVVVTNSPASYLARAAGVLLITQARESRYRSGAMASRTAQHAVVDVLFTRVTQALFDESSESLRRTYESVQGHRRVL